MHKLIVHIWQSWVENKHYSGNELLGKNKFGVFVSAFSLGQTVRRIIQMWCKESWFSLRWNVCFLPVTATYRWPTLHSPALLTWLPPIFIGASLSPDSVGWVFVFLVKFVSGTPTADGTSTDQSSSNPKHNNSYLMYHGYTCNNESTYELFTTIV